MKTKFWFGHPVIYAALVFLISFTWFSKAALDFPLLFNQDNIANYAATNYLAKHHRIPVVRADNPDIEFSRIGTTRSLRPPLTFIVAASSQELLQSSVGDDIRRQRIGGALLGALTVVSIFVGFYIAFASIIYALAGSILIGSIPRFLLLASSNNDDVGAIFSASCMFAATLAVRRYGNQTWVYCVLAIAVGLVLQTKFTAWLVLPWLLLYCFVRLMPYWHHWLRLSPLLALLLIGAGGWWPLFNMLHYGVTDPTALVYAEQIQQHLSSLPANRQGYASQGVSLFQLLSNHDDFWSISFRSLIGYLEWLQLDVNVAAYWFYGFILFSGLAYRVSSVWMNPRQHGFALLVILMVITQLALYLHHNWLRDIQAEGRYLLPTIMPMMYFALLAMRKISNTVLTLNIGQRSFGTHVILPGILCVSAIGLHINAYYAHYTPSFIHGPYFTQLSVPKQLDIKSLMQIRATSAVDTQFEAGFLNLRRTGTAIPTVQLSPETCALFHPNSLLLIDVESISPGGLNIAMQSNNSKFDQIAWQGFSHGKSTLVFALKANNCKQIELTLTRRTQWLKLSNPRIFQQSIHQYGQTISPHRAK